MGLLLFDSGGNEVTFDKQYSVVFQIIEATNVVSLLSGVSLKVVVTPPVLLVENMHSGKRALVCDKEIVVSGIQISLIL